MAGRKHSLGHISFMGVPVVTAEWIPPNEILIIVPEQRNTIKAHEGPQAGKLLDVVIRELRVTQTINLECEPPSEWRKE